MSTAPKVEGQEDPAADLVADTRIWLAPAGSGQDGKPCGAAPAFTAGRQFPAGVSSPAQLGWSSADAPRLHPCDAVYIKLRNAASTGADVTGLVIQPTGAVGALKDPVYGVRLDPGATGVYAWQFDPTDDPTPAISNIAFIIVQADPAVRIHADYSNLAQCAATDFTCAAGSTTTRSGDQGFAQGRARGFAELMDGVLDGQTRSGSVGSSIGSSGVLTYAWLLEPRP